MTDDGLERDYVRALGHPLRLRLLETILEDGEQSPVGLARRLDQPLSTVSRHIRMLRDMGFVELVRTEPRRGSVERFYKAASLAFISDADWERMPVMLRRGLVRQTFRKLFRDAADAGAAGGFDDANAHLDLVSFDLDVEGRDEVSAVLHDTLDRLREVQRQSDDRRGSRRRHTGRTLSTKVCLLHYRSADSSE